MNYFELYPGDYLRDTTRLSLVEHGAYLRLLMAYYAEAKPLPADFGELFVVVGAISAGDKAAVRKVADRFFPIAEDGLRRNARADREIEKAKRRIESARSNGRAGGRPPTKSKPKGEPTKNPAGNPPGFVEETQQGGPDETQPGTHSGEALHTPHASSTKNTSTPMDLHGAFEGERAGGEAASAQVVQIARVTACGLAARAAREAGAHDAASGHPSLIAALDAGVSHEQLLAFVTASLERQPIVDNPFAYACGWALRAHQANPGALPHEVSRGSGSQSAVERVSQNVRAAANAP